MLHYGAGVSVGSYIFGGYADVTVSNSTISNNSAEYGGGISVDTGSALRLVNSLVDGNQADIGGGIAAAYGATLTVVNTTISGSIPSPASPAMAAASRSTAAPARR